MGSTSLNCQNIDIDGNSDFLNDGRNNKFGTLHYAIKRQQTQWRQQKWMNDRAKPGASYEPTHIEHCANTISHAVMILPSIIAGELLLLSTKCYKPPESITNGPHVQLNSTATNLHYEVSARIYGISLVGLFLASTMFHWVTWCKTHHPTKTLGLSDNCCESALWNFLHLCDRAIIFLFISGSYTPWLMLNHVHPSLEWLRWGVWLFASLGITYSFLLLEKYKLLETILYVAQGILPALAILTSSDESHLHHLSVGGGFYLFGVLVFKSDGHIPCAHAIWHLFVAAGATSHFLACYSVLY